MHAFSEMEPATVSVGVERDDSNTHVVFRDGTLAVSTCASACFGALDNPSLFDLVSTQSRLKCGRGLDGRGHRPFVLGAINFDNHPQMKRVLVLFVNRSM